MMAWPFLNRVTTLASREFLLIITVCGLLLYSFAYFENCFGLPIRADGSGYYAYLPAYVIYGDPSLEELARNHYGGSFPVKTGIRRYEPTGRYLDRFGVGTSVMMLPFFLLAHGITMITRSPVDRHRFSYPADGYSFFYQHFAGLAGLFYLIVGVVLLRRSLERYFSEGITLATVLVLLFGTNLLHYGTGESVLSHAYSFSLFSALLYLVPKWYERPDSTTLSVLLGGVAGLIPLVRVPNALVLIFVPLFRISCAGEAAERLRFFSRHWMRLVLTLVVAFVVFSPQLFIWKYATGHWLVNPYQLQGEGFDFLKPAILNTLFSLKKGLLVWSPVLIFGVLGLWGLRAVCKDWALPTAVFLTVNLYVVSSWWMWWYGGSFGHRAFIESYAVLGFPMASFFAGIRSPRMKLMVVLVTVVMVAYSLALMTLYYTRRISYEGLDSQQLLQRFQEFFR